MWGQMSRCLDRDTDFWLPTAPAPRGPPGKGVQCILGPAPWWWRGEGGGASRGGRTTWARAGTALAGAPSGRTAGGAAHRCERWGGAVCVGGRRAAGSASCPAPSRAAVCTPHRSSRRDAWNPRSHAGRCSESYLWGARSQALGPGWGGGVVGALASSSWLGLDPGLLG